jgi:hypothetical protein
MRNTSGADTIQSLRRLCEWLDKSDYSGFDPYDIKEKPGIILLTEKGNQSLFYSDKRIVFELFYSFPCCHESFFGEAQNQCQGHGGIGTGIPAIV